MQILTHWVRRAPETLHFNKVPGDNGGPRLEYPGPEGTWEFSYAKSQEFGGHGAGGQQVCSLAT